MFFRYLIIDVKCFSLHLKNIVLLESVQKVFTKRLCGQNLFHLIVFDRLKHFSPETLERERIKYDSISLYGLYMVSVILTFQNSFQISPSIFDTRGNRLKADTEHFSSGLRRRSCFSIE